MESPNSDSDSNFDNISRELTRLRIAAASALKNIDLIYEEVIGCNPSKEFGNDEEDGNGVNQTSDGETDSSRECYGVPNSNREVHHFTESVCQRCHRIFMPYVQVCRPACNILFRNECLAHSQCPSCGRFKSACLTSDSHPVKVTPHPEKSEKNDRKEDIVTSKSFMVSHHECPLKVTIPEPFQMTIREEGKKEIRELKHKELKHKLNETVEKELRIRIHSNPVPGHTYLPMYKRLAELNEERKKKRKELAEKLVRNCVKPFSLTETKKTLRRVDSMPQLVDNENCKMFKANPLPKHILSDSVDEKLKNSEIERKQRIHQRAEILLQQSSLPFSSKNSLKKSLSVINLKDCKTHERKPKRNNASNKYFVITPQESRDFMRTWKSKVSEFHTSCKSSHHDGQKIVHKRSKSFSSKLPHYDVPVRKTTASMLREQVVRNDLSENHSKNKGKDWEDNYEQRRQEYKGNLTNRLKLASLSTKSQRELEKKLQEFRASRKNRQAEYERELHEMRKRIEKRPLLIERQTNKNKGKNGSDENSQSNKSSRTSSQTGEDGDSSDSQADFPDSSTAEND